eukprot:1400879-Rhodomonas_salina.1
MHRRARRWTGGDAGPGATAIIVGGVCAIPNSSSGATLDRGWWLSSSGAFCVDVTFQPQAS